MIPSPALRARVLLAAAASKAPTRSQLRKRTLAALAVSLAIALGVFLVTGGLSLAAPRPLGITLRLTGGWAVACIGQSALALWRSGSTLPRPPWQLAGIAWLTPLVAFLWTRLFDGSYAEPPERFDMRCLLHTLLMAIAPLASFMALRRGVEPRAPAALGAAAGAVCGAWAGVFVDLSCPLTNAPHVLVGHVLPLTMLSGAGALVGHHVLGVRHRKASSGMFTPPALFSKPPASPCVAPARDDEAPSRGP